MSSQSTVLPAPALATPSSKPGMRWFVCGLLFAATTINYMDRTVFSLIEPLLHKLPFMGWNFSLDAAHQVVFNNNFGNIIICFQVAYGIGLLTAGRIVDKVGTKIGYALAISIWALSSMSHAFVTSVFGFCLARVMLGLGESGNFPAAIKATTEWFPSEERALATGLFNSGSNASAFIAPALVAAVTLRWGWQAGFLSTGSLGLLWLVVWLLFPYDKMHRAAFGEVTLTSDAGFAPAAPARSGTGFFTLFAKLSRTRQLWAFALGKGLTDPIWWFYLFYLPKFLHENYGLDLAHAYWQIVTVYAISSVGSIAGGWLSGFRMKQGHTVNYGRKFAMLVCAVCVLPVMLVPRMGHLFPTTAWPAVLLIALAAAAHQGWSANIFSTATDMFPSTAVSTVVGIGGAVGAAGGATFTWIVKHYFALHPLVIFTLAAFAYVTALTIIHLMVPRLGETKALAAA